MATDFSNICLILGKLYYEYNQDASAFQDFIQYNDIGLPLAYLIAETLCEPTQDGEKYILETWELFIAALGISDTGFTSLDEMLDLASKKDK